MTAYGSQEMSANLVRVLMRRPGASLASADPAQWHYGPTFDGEKAVRQYTEFASLVEKSGAEILWLEDKGDGLADAMFTHDPSLMSNHGAIILRMGKPLREKETALHEAAYKKAGIPILGRIVSPGTVEGGDCIWLDAETLIEQLATRLRKDSAPDALQWIRASVGSTVQMIAVGDIDFLRSDEKYTRIAWRDEGKPVEALIRTPLKELVAQLDATQFAQVHRSVVVNLRAIGHVTRGENETARIHLKARDDVLPVSRHYLHLFRQM